MCRCLAWVAAVLLLSPSAQGGEAKKSDSRGRFALELGGVKTGYLKSVDGGGIGAAVTPAQGGDGRPGKRLGKVEYEDFTIKLPIYAPPPVTEWIKKTWVGERPRMEGKLIAVDNFLGAIGERHFSDALIVETAFPACDMDGKDQAYLTLKVHPESIRYRKGDGAEVVVPPKAKRNKWIPSNFRLKIKGLDTRKVVKIDPFSVKQVFSSGAEASGGGSLPGTEFPHLRITIADDGAESWIRWHEDFAIKGNNSPDKEKSGDLELLDTDRKNVLLTVRFKGLGIFGFLPDTRDPEEDQIHQVCFDLYTKGMSLERGGEPAR